jgi:hypothetical protein
MDTIKDMLIVFSRFALGIFGIIFVWFVITLVFPDLTITALRESFASRNASSTLKTKGANDDWLPDPRTYKGLFAGTTTPNENTNVYKPAPEFNGYGNTQSQYTTSKSGYIRYTASGTVVVAGDGTEVPYKEYDYQSGTVKNNTNEVVISPSTASTTQPVKPAPFVYSKKELYIRNLSIYEGGYLYTGLSFVGEAKSTMFINGAFPIIVADGLGKVVTVLKAEATNDFAPAGWTRFQAKIVSQLPEKVRCSVVFEQAVNKNQYPFNDGGQPVRVIIPVLCN